MLIIFNLLQLEERPAQNPSKFDPKNLKALLNKTLVPFCENQTPNMKTLFYQDFSSGSVKNLSNN